VPHDGAAQQAQASAAAVAPCVPKQLPSAAQSAAGLHHLSFLQVQDHLQLLQLLQTLVCCCCWVCSLTPGWLQLLLAVFWGCHLAEHHHQGPNCPTCQQ
jgi:hypothetical protein